MDVPANWTKEKDKKRSSYWKTMWWRKMGKWSSESKIVHSSEYLSLGSLTLFNQNETEWAHAYWMWNSLRKWNSSNVLFTFYTQNNNYVLFMIIYPFAVKWKMDRKSCSQIPIITEMARKLEFRTEFFRSLPSAECGARSQ